MFLEKSYAEEKYLMLLKFELKTVKTVIKINLTF